MTDTLSFAHHPKELRERIIQQSILSYAPFELEVYVLLSIENLPYNHQPIC